MTNILVVGGSGFLGAACLRKLASYEVTIIGRKERADFSENKNFKYYYLNIHRLEDVKKFLEKNQYSHLLYMAWPRTPPHNAMEHLSFAVSSIDFLKIFSQYNSHARIVFTGSIHEAGQHHSKVANDFEHLKPENLYGLSKKFVWDCFNVLRSSNFKNISFCWVRLANIYGVGDHSHKALYNIILNALSQKEFSLNNPNAFLDLVHIEDAAKGVALALLSDYNGVINIGGGYGYFLKEIQDFIELYINNKMDGKNLIKIKKYSNSEFGSVLDIEKSCEILDYSPVTVIESEIIEYINFVKKVAQHNEKI
jgi:nucleoside-diphosphate-sugar epimerase